MDNSIALALIVCITILLGYVFLLFFKSKCSDVMCGSCKIHRNTDQEDKSAEQMTLPIPNLPHAVSNAV